MSGLKYILITAARDEAEFIEFTIQSVLRQTIRPIKWILVDDGSTDGTGSIIRRYSNDHPWIEVIRMPERQSRNFSGKAYAFNAAYAMVKDLQYDVIGNLDADVSFESDYFCHLLRHLAEDPTLGVVGTPFKQIGSDQTYDYRLVGVDHVSGACQLFRRECLHQIGGYTAVNGGGVDYIALISARMYGWKTKTFTDQACWHHRAMGTAEQSPLRARFKVGMKDYNLGSHPIWEGFRVCYQITRKPVLIGGFVLGSGYVWALLRRTPRSISPEMVAFRRREQLQRLRSLFTKGLSWIPFRHRNMHSRTKPI